MKRSLLLAVLLSMLFIAPAMAQVEGAQMPLGQYPPYQGTPWMNRGPGMGNYGMGNIGPGMGNYGMGNIGPGMGNYGMGNISPGGAVGRWGGNLPMPSNNMSNSGYYNAGPGVMMGQGMMQFGMGPGMIRGVGAMGYISSEAFQKFFDDTREARKELHNLMFDYAELLRKPEYDATERVKIENKLMELRQKVYNHAPRYQWPFK